MEKILIALDYNPSAQKVAEMGNKLAKSMHAEIILLHVVSDAAYYASPQYSPIMGFDGSMDMGMIQPETENELKKAAEKYLEKSKEYLGDETIKVHVVEGDFAEAILSAVASLHADIIVMGTHSRRGLDKILMGSVAEKVLRRATIPIFIIPTREV